LWRSRGPGVAGFGLGGRLARAASRVLPGARVGPLGQSDGRPQAEAVLDGLPGGGALVFAPGLGTRRKRLEPERESARGRTELPLLKLTAGTAAQEIQLCCLNKGLKAGLAGN